MGVLVEVAEGVAEGLGVWVGVELASESAEGSTVPVELRPDVCPPGWPDWSFCSEEDGADEGCLEVSVPDCGSDGVGGGCVPESDKGVPAVIVSSCSVKPEPGVTSADGAVWSVAGETAADCPDVTADVAWGEGVALNRAAASAVNWAGGVVWPDDESTAPDTAACPFPSDPAELIDEPAGLTQRSNQSKEAVRIKIVSKAATTPMRDQKKAANQAGNLVFVDELPLFCTLISFQVEMAFVNIISAVAG